MPDCYYFSAGCARPIKATGINDSQNEFWTGRIGLQVQSEPAQSFSAGFELKGKPERGELTLISPLGNVLGVLRWSPLEAVLDSGNRNIQRFSSVDAMMDASHRRGRAAERAVCAGCRETTPASAAGPPIYPDKAKAAFPQKEPSPHRRPTFASCSINKVRLRIVQP